MEACATPAYPWPTYRARRNDSFGRRSSEVSREKRRRKQQVQSPSHRDGRRRHARKPCGLNRTTSSWSWHRGLLRRIQDRPMSHDGRGGSGIGAAPHVRSPGEGRNSKLRSNAKKSVVAGEVSRLHSSRFFDPPTTRISDTPIEIWWRRARNVRQIVFDGNKQPDFRDFRSSTGVRPLSRPRKPVGAISSILAITPSMQL